MMLQKTGQMKLNLYVVNSEYSSLVGAAIAAAVYLLSFALGPAVKSLKRPLYAAITFLVEAPERLINARALHAHVPGAMPSASSPSTASSEHASTKRPPSASGPFTPLRVVSVHLASSSHAKAYLTTLLGLSTFSSSGLSSSGTERSSVMPGTSSCTYSQTSRPRRTIEGAAG